MKRSTRSLAVHVWNRSCDRRQNTNEEARSFFGCAQLSLPLVPPLPHLPRRRKWQQNPPKPPPSQKKRAIMNAQKEAEYLHPRHTGLNGEPLVTQDPRTGAVKSAPPHAAVPLDVAKKPQDPAKTSSNNFLPAPMKIIRWHQTVINQACDPLVLKFCYSIRVVQYENITVTLSEYTFSVEKILIAVNTKGSHA